ncbi:MAG: type I methionyl aminopeptidase [Minisyncoccales bacterium]|jgi:methionyl aminopeptidase
MIKIKSQDELKIIREGSKLLAKTLQELKEKSKSGVTTAQLNRLAEELILGYGGKPSFKGYGGFPATICTSINDEIVHGVPSERVLEEGDVFSIDIGMLYKGFHSDMATTLIIGDKIDSEAARLVRTTRKALKRGIKKVRPGNTFGDIGNTIQRYVESQGFSVVEGLCGHGIGRELHEAPEVHNFGKRRSGPEIKEGMVFCIEPMVSAGGPEIMKDEDGFAFKTKDGSLSAHFEHTIAVTSSGFEVMTE